LSTKNLGAPQPKKCAWCCATAARSTRSTSKTTSPKMAIWPWRKFWASMTPEEAGSIVKRSGLRGRGGAGFPAGKKWELCRNVQGSPKYLTCNADEGDPGAFMNRRVLGKRPAFGAGRHDHRRLRIGASAAISTAAPNTRWRSAT
jgi:NADH:ubiquinone oxidoreductase subunit F (NADH-binding)